MGATDRWLDLDLLLTRPGAIVGPGFEPGPELREFLQSDNCKILCVGAGGLGCEILKDLALSGFVNIDVIDMDTIDVSNLNRQFLFRNSDVGKPKAVVAAERVNARVSGAKVTPHYCRIEDQPIEFYQEFTLIILGLDSLEARRYMNSVVCNFLEYDDEGKPDLSTVKPMIDGGTEGFRGHARVIVPGITPCFECTMWLFPPQTKFPLCTLAETPRTPAHCIEYAHLIQWPQLRIGEDFDADNDEHLQWVFQKASQRADHFGISGVTYQLCLGVVKNIIPAIASTNAIIAAVCVLEALKTITLCSTGLNNYMMYQGSQGVYIHTVAHEKNENCPVCSPGLIMEVNGDSTLQQVVDQLMQHPELSGKIKAPSISYGSINLYMRGALEEGTRGNLSKSMVDLVAEASPTINVNDRALTAPIKVRLKFIHNMDS